MNSQGKSTSTYRSLTVRYIGALALIGIFSSFMSLQLNSLSATQAVDAPRINLSGRQRMLCQRISLLAIRLIHADNPSQASLLHDDLAAAVGLMERSHHALLFGDRELGISSEMNSNVHDLYFGNLALNSSVNEFTALARRVLAHDPSSLTIDNPALIAMVAKTDRLLAGLNRAVLLNEQDGQERINEIRGMEFAAWLCTVVLLFVEGLMIFRPMALQVRSQLNKNQAANEELIAKDRRIQLLLGSTGDGLLPVNELGQVTGGISSRVESWFGPVEEGKFFWDIIAEDSERSLEIELGFEQIVAGILPFDVAVSQAVSIVHIRGQVLGIDYREVFDEGKRTGFLLVIRDITSELAREKSEAETKEFGQILSNAMRDQHSFSRFIEETRNSLALAAAADVDDSTRVRVLHTVKGNTSIFGFERFSQQVHEAEGLLLSGEHARNVVPKLQQVWEQRVQQFQEIIVGRDDVWISKREHNRHIAHLTNNDALQRLVPEVKRWRFESAYRNLEQLAKGANRLASRLKKAVDVQIDADQELRLDADHFGKIWSSLIHVIRNAIDHGIELPELRKSVGKAVTGSLKLSCQIDAGLVTISIVDDGAGIDWKRIARKAAEEGMPNDTSEALIDALFTDGLSSREDANDISGRGVGMGALKAAVEEENGSITVQSEQGQGTQITLAIPLPKQSAYEDLHDQSKYGPTLIGSA